MAGLRGSSGLPPTDPPPTGAREPHRVAEEPVAARPRVRDVSRGALARGRGGTGAVRREPMKDDAGEDHAGAYELVLPGGSEKEGDADDDAEPGEDGPA